MRYLFLILLVCLTGSLFGQGTFPVPSTGGGLPIKQYLGSDSTLMGNRGIFWSKFGDVYGVFADTTAANRTRIKQYPFARIATTSDQITWVRNKTATKWLTSNQAGGSGGSTTTTINGDTLFICDGTGNCDTLLFTGGGDIFNYYFLNDSTLLACGDTTVVCNVDTCIFQQVCDTFNIPLLKSLVLQSGTERIGNLGYLGINATVDNPNGNPFSSYLQRPTLIHTFAYPYGITGFPVWTPIVEIQHQQIWGIASSIATFKSAGSGITSALDYQNAVKLRINYTGNKYGAGAVAVVDSGYFGDRIGYYLTTSLSDRASYGLGVDDPNSKYSGIFFHTLDNSYTDAITIFGGVAPGDGMINDPLEAPNTPLSSKKIAIFKTDKSIQWNGYTSTNLIRADSSNFKPLVVDASGNMHRSYWLGGGSNTDSLFGIEDNISTVDREVNFKFHDFTLDSIKFWNMTDFRSISNYSEWGDVSLGQQATNTYFQQDNGIITSTIRDNSTSKSAEVTLDSTSYGIEVFMEAIGGPGLGTEVHISEKVLDLFQYKGRILIDSLTKATDTTSFAFIMRNMVNDSVKTLTYSQIRTALGTTYTASNDVTLSDNNFVSGGTGDRYTNTDWGAFTRTHTFNSIDSAGWTISSTSTAAANNQYKLFYVNATGTNATTTQTTYGAFISNAHAGTLSTNVGLHSEVSNGTANNIGIEGIADVAGGIGSYGRGNQWGGQFIATTGNGVEGQSNSGFAGNFQLNSTSTNTISPIIQAVKLTNGTAAAGFGTSFVFQLENAGGSASESNTIVSKWTTATAGSTASQFTITGVNAGVTGNLISWGGGGAPQYTVNTVSGTTNTLTVNSKYVQVFTGSSGTTWTLPAIGNTGLTYIIKNRGSAAITLNSNAGGNDIYTTSAVNTLTINAGESYIISDDGTYFIIY